MEKEVRDFKEAVRVFRCLSNAKRLKLLQGVVKEGGDLRGIHERIGKEIGLSHRETTHSYLEELYDAGLVEKEGATTYYYSSDVDILRLDLESL